MDLERVKKFAALTALKREIKAKLNEVEADLSALETELLEAYALEGVQSLRVDTDGYGRWNVGLKSQIWASPKDGDYEVACRVLREAGLGDFVQERFNSQSLSAFVREAVASGQATLTEGESGMLLVSNDLHIVRLNEGLKISNPYKLSVTKAAKK